MAEICNFLPQVDQQCKPKSYQVDFRTRSLPEFFKKNYWYINFAIRSSSSTFNYCLIFQLYLFDKTIKTCTHLQFFSWIFSRKFFLRKSNFFWRQLFVILSIHNSSLGSYEVPQKIWVGIGLDTNKQINKQTNDKQSLYIDVTFLLPKGPEMPPSLFSFPCSTPN